jgi:hypothetical protein
MRTSFDGPIAAGTKQAGIAGGPNVGLVVLNQTVVVVTNGANARADAVIYLPPNSRISTILVDVLTPFNNTGAATVTAGLTSGATDYMSGVDAKTAGRATPAFTAAQLAAMADIGANTTLVVTITPAGASAAGNVRATVTYVQRDS